MARLTTTTANLGHVVTVAADGVTALLAGQAGLVGRELVGATTGMRGLATHAGNLDPSRG
jgi:hypothetical protein